MICLSEMFEDRQRRFIVSFQPLDAATSVSEPILFTSTEHLSRTKDKRKHHAAPRAPSSFEVIVHRREGEEQLPRIERVSTPPVNRRIRVTISSKQQPLSSNKKASKTSDGAYVSSGRVYVMGFFYVDYAAHVNKYLDQLSAGKKTKPLVHFLRKLGVELPRQPDLLFPAPEVIQHATQISCGENSTIIVGMFPTQPRTDGLRDDLDDNVRFIVL
jgi:hypothetical protein